MNIHTCTLSLTVENPDDESAPARRRVGITLSDLQTHGFTLESTCGHGCPRWALHSQGQHRRAQHHKHTECCRARIYKALRDAGASKIQHADVDRTQTKQEQQKNLSLPTTDSPDSKSSVPPTPKGEDPLDTSSPRAPGVDQSDSELFGPSDDETEFYKIVNDDAEIQENAKQLSRDDEPKMVAMLDVLQTLGVSPGVATTFAASISRDKPRFKHLRDELDRARRLVGATTGTRPSFMEVYGRGKILEAAHGCRRNLNLEGLHAMDLRTLKEPG